MNKLVVLNPLIVSLLMPQDYQALLERIKSGGDLARDSIPGIVEVKEQYQNWITEAREYPVVDNRCPYVRDIVCRDFPQLEHLLAPIDPILINGAEIRRRELGNIEVCVIAPCKGFHRYATPSRQIYTWQEFKDAIQFHPQQTQTTTPVPLGFFGELGVRIYSTSGEENCYGLLANYPKDAQLLELLFCEGGCHKGDGL